MSSGNPSQCFLVISYAENRTDGAVDVAMGTVAVTFSPCSIAGFYTGLVVRSCRGIYLARDLGESDSTALLRGDFGLVEDGGKVDIFSLSNARSRLWVRGYRCALPFH